MKTITFDDFIKLEVKIGKIISAERVEGSDKLLKLEVDFGTETAEVNTMESDTNALMSEENEEPKQTEIPIKKQIIAGIGKIYNPEDLIGKQCPFAYNLAPRMLKGLESQGMIMCPSIDGKPALLHPDKEVPNGSNIK